LYISCALINGGKSIFLTKGGSVFLKRGDKVGRILISEDEIKVLSGSYTKEDIFVLTTLQASEFLSEIEQKFTQGFDTDIIITSIVPGLHAQDDSSLSAIVFINSLKDKNSDNDKDIKPLVSVETEQIEDEVSAMSVSMVRDDKKDVGNETNEIDESEDGRVIEKKVRLVNEVQNKTIVLLKKIASFLKKFGKKFLVGLSIFTKWLTKLIKNFSIIITSFLLMLFRKNGAKKMGIILAITTILIIFGVLSIFNRAKEAKRISSLLLPAQMQVLDAKKSLSEDVLASRDQVSSALEKLKQLKQENEYSSKISLIDEQIELATKFYDEISGKKELSLLDIFYDLRLIKSDYLANQVTMIDNYLVLLDSEKKQVVLLDTTSKKVKVVDFSKFDTVRGLGSNEDGVFVLANGIQEFGLDNQEIDEVRTLGDSNRDTTLISAYDRFIYVVNPEKRNIYRYSKEEDGYSDPIGWMKSSGGLQYDSITSFAVDGDVWVATNKGELLKFSSGKLQDFTVLGLDDGFSGDIKVFSNKDQKNIYVLEADKNRVVILDKEGKFVKEIKSISIKTVTSVVANEKIGKMFLVSGSVVFEVGL